MKNSFLLICFIFSVNFLSAQDESSQGIYIGVSGGIVNYQGDLQPHSFFFEKAKLITGAWVRVPINSRVSVRGGISMGKIGASDADNRDYLRERNLSFYTNLKEAYLVADVSLLDMMRTPFTPYVYGGAVVFRFNPYTYDQNGIRVHLQPLGTEGQGLEAYPDRKPYKLTQAALTFGGGIRVAVNSFLNIAAEVGQRKTFTDYLDDISKDYADEGLLRAGNGDQAAALAFRGDEIHGLQYPEAGSQRGSPREMDWYYTLGMSLELKLQRFKAVLKTSRQDAYNRRCPKF